MPGLPPGFSVDSAPETGNLRPDAAAPELTPEPVQQPEAGPTPEPAPQADENPQFEAQQGPEAATQEEAAAQEQLHQEENKVARQFREEDNQARGNFFRRAFDMAGRTVQRVREAIGAAVGLAVRAPVEAVKAPFRANRWANQKIDTADERIRGREAGRGAFARARNFALYTGLAWASAKADRLDNETINSWSRSIAEKLGFQDESGTTERIIASGIDTMFGGIRGELFDELHERFTGREIIGSMENLLALLGELGYSRERPEKGQQAQEQPFLSKIMDPLTLGLIAEALSQPRIVGAAFERLHNVLEGIVERFDLIERVRQEAQQGPAAQNQPPQRPRPTSGGGAAQPRGAQIV